MTLRNHEKKKKETKNSGPYMRQSLRLSGQCELMIGRDCALGGKVVSGLQQSLHLKPVRNSCLV